MNECIHRLRATVYLRRALSPALAKVAGAAQQGGELLAALQDLLARLEEVGVQQRQQLGPQQTRFACGAGACVMLGAPSQAPRSFPRPILLTPVLPCSSSGGTVE